MRTAAADLTVVVVAVAVEVGVARGALWLRLPGVLEVWSPGGCGSEMIVVAIGPLKEPLSMPAISSAASSFCAGFAGATPATNARIVSTPCRPSSCRRANRRTKVPARSSSDLARAGGAVKTAISSPTLSSTTRPPSRVMTPVTSPPNSTA